MEIIPQRMRYDSQRDPRFAQDLMGSSRCKTLTQCIQCGTCSGLCPLSAYMDLTPRRVINLARAGFKNDALSCNTIWLCASCYACAVECPKKVSITDIMYSLKRLAIREGLYPKGSPIPVLAREFSRMVRSRGRATESRLVLNLYLKTNLLKLLGMWRMGLKLITRGRFSFRAERIERVNELRTVLATATAEAGEGPVP
ncbi:MAG: 4Fe-4S dicluster domain-containing protein [Candidatus Sumerlaeota bacterium]|nr:4Fe-4S dicluster domain-containing protein [Candidatus Sumerlaeota bacterium]